MVLPPIRKLSTVFLGVKHVTFEGNSREIAVFRFDCNFKYGSNSKNYLVIKTLITQNMPDSLGENYRKVKSEDKDDKEEDIKRKFRPRLTKYFALSWKILIIQNF